MVIYRQANVTLASAFPIKPLTISYLVFIIHFRFKTSLQNVMSKREKLGCQTIDKFFTKSVPSTHLPDVPCKQRTVDEDASNEESSNVALPQDIETESPSSVASCSGSSPQYIEGARVAQ
jgi:hypothetical protein